MPDSLLAQRPCVLVIDDDAQHLELMREILQDYPVEILSAASYRVGLELVQRARPALVFLDLFLPGVTGLNLLTSILGINPITDVVLMTAYASTESAVEAIQLGAYDYLTKPLSIERLRQRIDKWQAELCARQRAKMPSPHSGLDDVIGRSPAMAETLAKIQRIGPHFRTALITGETGTGKDRMARLLHQLSPVHAGPYAICNSAAIAESLFESELFGYVKGAFTGATQNKQGLVEYANGGTLFLDEIGEMPLAAQAKLLRLLQNREVQRLGSPQVQKVDIRVVAATNRDLRSMVKDKTFREDLYYRLAAVQIALPRLADRKEDLPHLIRHFLSAFAAQYDRPRLSLSRQAEAVLHCYSWPGNVRELENCLSYSCMMSESDLIGVRDLPPELSGAAGKRAEDTGILSLEAVEWRHVEHVLTQLSGNRVRAAEVLGISRATLYRILSRHQTTASST